jgi:hypothetical protein
MAVPRWYLVPVRMTNEGGGDFAMSDTYELRVKGQLDDRWSDSLGGLAVQRQGDGTTLLVGPVVDQAALHGVINRIRDLGLPLLSVQRIGHSGEQR